MFTFSILTSAFFAIYWREERKDIIKLFLKIAGYMILGGIATAWIIALLHPR